MPKRSVPKHSEETKARALRRIAEGVKVADVAKSFGVGKSTLDKWKRQKKENK